MEGFVPGRPKGAYIKQRVLESIASGGVNIHEHRYRVAIPNTEGGEDIETISHEELQSLGVDTSSAQTIDQNHPDAHAVIEAAYRKRDKIRHGIAPKLETTVTEPMPELAEVVPGTEVTPEPILEPGGRITETPATLGVGEHLDSLRAAQRATAFFSSGTTSVKGPFSLMTAGVVGLGALVFGAYYLMFGTVIKFWSFLGAAWDKNIKPLLKEGKKEGRHDTKNDHSHGDGHGKEHH